jgi:hypothetical protein
MAKLKTINSDALLEEQLKDEEFRGEYEALEEEFEIAKEIIRLRKTEKLPRKQFKCQEVATNFKKSLTV